MWGAIIAGAASLLGQSQETQMSEEQLRYTQDLNRTLAKQWREEADFEKNKEANKRKQMSLDRLTAGLNDLQTQLSKQPELKNQLISMYAAMARR